MTVDAVIAALNLPTGARVDQRVPKRLLLENGAPTAVDKRLINEGIQEIRWLAALKPATCGVPEFRGVSREYLEIAVLQVVLREGAKADRLVELVHRAVPYPVLLLVDVGDGVKVSLAHKRQALKEADKVVLDGEILIVDLRLADSTIRAAFLQSLDIARQPKISLYALYQGWLDTAIAVPAAVITGAFRLLDSAELATARRDALHVVLDLQGQVANLRTAAARASQMARQVELNLEIRRLQAQLVVAQAQL